MKKTLISLAVVWVVVCLAACSKGHFIGGYPEGKGFSDGENFPKKTFVLVHGAWQAPYAWEFVGPQLKAEGQKVVIVQLPGHGTDTTDPATLTIDVYRDAVINAMNVAGIKGSDKVILVGHSLAGMVISAVAEKIPDEIEKLVYIGAYLPANGNSLISLANTDSHSYLGPALQPLDINPMLGVPNLLGIPLDSLDNIFCQDGDSFVQQQIVANYRPEPGPPFFNPVVLTAAHFGKADKYYIHTLQDRVVSPELQNSMIKQAGIPSSRVFPINTSHTPFLSKPDSLTALLLNLTKKGS